MRQAGDIFKGSARVNKAKNTSLSYQNVAVYKSYACLFPQHAEPFYEQISLIPVFWHAFVQNNNGDLN